MARRTDKTIRWVSRAAASVVLGVLLLAGGAWAQSATQTATAQSELDRAYALLSSGKLEEAAAAFERVVERDPDNRTARLELAYVSGRLGRWDEAVKHFAAVVEQEPENLRVRLDYGYALEKAGAVERAAEQFAFVAGRPGEFQEQARAALQALRERQAAALARARDERIARRDAYLNRGYARLRAGDRIGARSEFEQALNEDPENPAILKQIGYLAIQEGNLPLAVENFSAVHRLAPEDTEAALQLGYLYDRTGQPEKAEEAFRDAAGSPDARTQRSARAALRTIEANRPARLYLDVFAAPLYSTRFDDGIAQFEAQLHWRPRPGWPLTLYTGTRITKDSRSRGGNLPAIFSDNVALVGAGVSFRPKRTNLTLLAEANLAFNLTQTAARNRDVEPDYRVVLYYFRRWESGLYGPIGAVTLGRVRSERLFTDLDASLGYYSRYDHNGIAYLQLREGLRLAEWGPSRLYGYGKLNLAKDTNRDFFNNVGEVGAGLEFRPNARLNLGLRVEYLRGIYYGIEGADPNPFRPQYNDVRVTLLFGHRFRMK